MFFRVKVNSLKLWILLGLVRWYKNGYARYVNRQGYFEEAEVFEKYVSDTIKARKIIPMLTKVSNKKIYTPKELKKYHWEI